MRFIIRLLVIVVLGGGIAYYVTFSLPAVQRWLGQTVAGMLSEQLGARVTIKSIDVSMPFNPILDGVTIYDQRGDTLLDTQRASTRLYLLPLLEGRYEIGHVQLYRPKLGIRRDADGLNCQFVLDLFESSNEGQSSTNLHINTILLRHGMITYDENDECGETLRRQVADDLSLTINRVDYADHELTANITDIDMTIADLRLNNMSCDLTAGREVVRVSNMSFELGESRLTNVVAEWCQSDGAWSVTCHDAVVGVSQILGSSLWQGCLPRLVDVVRLNLCVEGTDSTIVVSEFDIEGVDLSARLTAEANLRTRELEVDTLQLNVGRNLLSRLASYVPYDLAEYSELCNQDLSIALSGRYAPERSWIDAHVMGDLADVECHALMHDGDSWRLSVEVPQMYVASLIEPLLAEQVNLLPTETTASLSVEANGSQRQRTFDVSARGWCDSREAKTSFDVAMARGADGDAMLRARVVVPHFDTEAFAFTRAVRGLQKVSMQADVDLHWTHLESTLCPTGSVVLSDFYVTNDTLCVEPLLNNLVVAVVDRGNGQGHAYISGDAVNGFVTLLSMPRHKNITDIPMRMALSFNDTRLINRLAHTNITLLGDELTMKMENDSVMQLTLSCDSLRYGNHRLNAINMRSTTDFAQGEPSSSPLTDVVLHACRQTRYGLTDIDVNALMLGDSLMASVSWIALQEMQGVNSSDSTNCGALSVTMYRGDTTRVNVNPTMMMLDGERWDVRGGVARVLPNGTLAVEDVVVECGERYARANGVMSSSFNDTLRVEMNRFSLDNLFALSHVKSVDLGGDITGVINVVGGVKHAKAEGLLTVPELRLNGAEMGAFNGRITWDTPTMMLGIEGHLGGEGVRETWQALPRVPTDMDVTVAVGLVPGNNYLDLRLDTRGANLAFLNQYTRKVFGEVYGAGTGQIHVYGPFRRVVIDGNMHIDHAMMDVPMIGGLFRIASADVSSRDGEFVFTDIRAYDKDASTVGNTHLITGNGRLTHDNFKSINYDYEFATHRAKVYDVPTFGSQRFRATAVLDDGSVKLWGAPGQVNVDVRGNVVLGSYLEYNHAAPESVVNDDFITFVSRETAANGTSEESTYNMGQDINVSLTLNMTSDALFEVLMDARTGDKISLNGQGSINARYYNKGAFRMNGIYRVTGGSYGLSIPGTGNIVRRNLRFIEGGTITFSEVPMQADLNLQAVYGVSVDLNSLAGGNLFSSSRTDVNCIMNIMGKVSAPHVTFDFDLHDASNEERQMVRSLVNTEEERNMQAIYLLGFNSFYALGDDMANLRGNMAMNGFLSSTLSTQINSFISSAMGQSNWSFDTNISTGQMGWNDIQAEGSLSGRLFNDRLLVNGTFGYRDGSSLSQHTGFVGDFDIRWRLNRAGTINLKAYSQTTDRYFTKSSLTTQGVGVIFNKNFNSLYDLFGIKRKNTKNR